VPAEKTKLATGLPKPRELTKEDLERLAEEGRRLAKAVAESGAKMEQITGEDLAVVVGGPGCSCRSSGRIRR
jgi:hypothetical protein